MKSKKSAIILVALACVLATILVTKNDAKAGAACSPNQFTGDGCASDEYCYVKTPNLVHMSGVCVRVTFIKQVP